VTVFAKNYRLSEMRGAQQFAHYHRFGRRSHRSRMVKTVGKYDLYGTLGEGAFGK
jgi:hypothetical protein